MTSYPPDLLDFDGDVAAWDRAMEEWRRARQDSIDADLADRPESEEPEE